MRALVVDASVAVKWFVSEADSDAAERLLGSTGTFHAPELLKSELTNALWKNITKGMISEEQATSALAGIERSITKWHPVDPLLPQALAWAVEHAHPIYDFCYLALARSLGVTMVTADKRLLRTLGGTPAAEYATSLSEIR
ncbi:type II toxin-antitoxin system VapC family toxin [Enterovirga sp. CN4-39]|uniref:type II toxin-antitoxin system VapC family toxin n=1 Tax=Enterovirga sp. CN4-39 TaxID=3400910 RepID=UPI003C112C0E